MKFKSREITDGVNVTPTHPLKELCILVGGIVGTLVAIFFVLGWIAGWLVAKIPAKYEEKLGRLYAYAFADSTHSKELDAAEAYLQDIVDRLAADLPEKRFPYRVSIHCSQQANAFAIPGGQIVILSELLKQVQSEQELAMVLGHEIGHHVNRDHLRGLGRSLAIMTVMMAIGVSEQSGMAQKVANYTGNLLLLRYSRSAEMAADNVGFQLVQYHYAKPHGALDLFKTFEKLVPKSATKFPAWGLTHPHPQARFQRLRERLTKSSASQHERKPLAAGIFANICESKADSDNK